MATERRKKDFFWIGYSDLMTSLFFIVLILFVVTSVMQYSRYTESTKDKRNKDNIEQAIKNIDKKYFKYNDEYKKLVLTIDVSFPVYSADIYQLRKEKRKELIMAGMSLKKFIDKIYDNHNATFLLVVEGQASKDNYFKSATENNYVLSYNRALSLVNLWKENGINFSDTSYHKKCELIIAGSGQEGVLRSENNKANQRFLIHLLLKPEMK